MAHLQTYKFVELAATGSAGDEVAVEFNSGVPYSHYTVWVVGNVADVDAQPLINGIDDGSATNLTGVVAEKVFQCTVDEIRPASSSVPGAINVISSLKLTNNDTDPAKLSVYFMAIPL